MSEAQKENQSASAAGSALPARSMAMPMSVKTPAVYALAHTSPIPARSFASSRASQPFEYEPSTFQ